MVAQPIAVIRDVDDDGVLIQTLLHQRIHDPSNLVIDKADLAVSVGDNLAQLVVRLGRNAAVGLADFCKLGIGRFAL